MWYFGHERGEDCLWLFHGILRVGGVVVSHPFCVKQIFIFLNERFDEIIFAWQGKSEAISE